MRRIFMVAFAAACIVTLQVAFAAESKICISSDLGIVGVKPGDCFASGETEPLLDRQVLNMDDQPLVHTMTSQSETKSISTCRDYISLSSHDGWAPADERFDQVCNVVMMLSGAQPATQSFLRPGDADLKDLDRLTVLILPAMGDLDPMASPNMNTVADFVATGEVKAVTEGDSKASLGLTYNGILVGYRLVARGDIDNDTIEDLLVERITVGPGGERSVNPMLLTRIEKDGLLVLNAQFAD